MEKKYNPKKRDYPFSNNQRSNINPVKRIPKNFTPQSDHHQNYNNKTLYNHPKTPPKRPYLPNKMLKVQSDDFYSKQTEYSQNRPSASSHHFHHPWEAGNEFISPHRYNTKSQEEKEEDYDSEETFHLSLENPPSNLTYESLEKYNTNTIKFQKLKKREYDAIFQIKGRLSLTSRIIIKDGKPHLLLRNGATEPFKSPEDLISRYINKLIANCEKIFDHPLFENRFEIDFHFLSIRISHVQDTTFEVMYSPLKTRKIIKEIITTIHHGHMFRNSLFTNLEDVIESLQEDTELMDGAQKDQVCWSYYINYCCKNNCPKAHRFNQLNLPAAFKNTNITEKEFNNRILKDPKFVEHCLCYFELIGTCQNGKFCKFSHVVKVHMLNDRNFTDVNQCYHENKKKKPKNERN